MPKNTVIIGSTGSVGTQTIKVIQEASNDFCIAGLAAYSNQELLDLQAQKFNPKHGTTLDRTEAMQMVSQPDVDIVVIACEGTDWLPVLMAAIQAHKKIAMANKKMIVEFGEKIMNEIRRQNVEFVPVDSEHNAIFQILEGRNIEDVEKIILTCSGGPFYNTPKEQFKDITVEQALDHPTWNMGPGITIDSATMMNKALEIIEAKHLFNLEPEQIEVLVHPECIVHGIVEFKDGSSIAHMGYPDMRLPISHALYYPRKIKNTLPRINLTDKTLSFFKPDLEKFPSIGFAYNALRQKGNKASRLIKANEEAVEKFIKKEISFEGIFEYIKTTQT